MNTCAKHIRILINEVPNLDYYLTNDLHPLAKEIGKQVECEDIIVNYNLKSDSPKCIQKVVFNNTTYYEINFEKAYSVSRNSFNKLERYLINFIKLFFQDNATELITFLKELNCVSEDNLLEIEFNYNQEKKKNYKKRLKELVEC